MPARARGAGSLTAAGQLRRRRQESQAAQVARLAVDLPLEQLELPFCFSSELGPNELEHLTDAFASRRRPGPGQPMSEAGAEVVVCVGPGGVGKTTTAAAIALRGARAGRVLAWSRSTRRPAVWRTLSASAAWATSPTR